MFSDSGYAPAQSVEFVGNYDVLRYAARLARKGREDINRAEW